VETGLNDRIDGSGPISEKQLEIGSQLIQVLFLSAAVSDDRQQVSAHLQLGGYDPVAGALGRLCPVASAPSSGISTKQLAGCRRTPGRSRTPVVFHAIHSPHLEFR